MNYYEFSFDINSEEEFHKDLLIHALGEAGFDTFEETAQGFNAYISASLYQDQQFRAAVQPFEGMFNFSYQQREIAQKNWNEEWESNFEPLSVKGECYVRATFHEPQPGYSYEIVIDPKMAFGTGHHQTTTMMMEWILEDDMKGKTVLDMGCGTGILAILASKAGAAQLTAIDYDPVCYESTLENAALNGTGNIEALCGSKDAIPPKSYDIILANINRNILLDQIERYSEAMHTGSLLYLSGFYDADCEVLIEAAKGYTLVPQDKKVLDNWVSLKLVKA